MDHRSSILLRFLVFTALFLAAKTVVACVCTNPDFTILGRFADARFVVIARVLAVEKIPEPDTTRTRMVIEKVYKGNLRVGHEMIFGQGEGGSCIEDFDEDDIGTKFLFFLKPKEKNPTVVENQNLCRVSIGITGMMPRTIYLTWRKWTK